MRTIKIPFAVLLAALKSPCPRLSYCVEVGWPELRLTEEQIIANAAAHVNGQETPYPNLSIFNVELETWPS